MASDITTLKEALDRANRTELPSLMSQVDLGSFLKAGCGGFTSEDLTADGSLQATLESYPWGGMLLAVHDPAGTPAALTQVHADAPVGTTGFAYDEATNALQFGSSVSASDTVRVSYIGLTLGDGGADSEMEEALDLSWPITTAL